MLYHLIELQHGLYEIIVFSNLIGFQLKRNNETARESTFMQNKSVKINIQINNQTENCEKPSNLLKVLLYNSKISRTQV